MEKHSPSKQVEMYLLADRRYNEEHKIWQSNNVIIGRLLADKINMKGVYAELFEKCPPSKQYDMTGEQWQFVIAAIVDVAAGWNPPKIKSVRDDVKNIKDLNAEIKKAAYELADLLRKRDGICDRSSITRPFDYHPIYLLEPAARISDIVKPSPRNTYYLYTGHVKDSVESVAAQFDLKYWPRTADLVEALAEAQDIEPVSNDRLTATALEVRQASVRDFFRAFGCAMTDLKSWHGINIEFSDKAFSALVSCILDEPIEEAAIHKFRADELKSKK